METMGGARRAAGDWSEVSREVEGIARDVAPSCGQGAEALGARAARGACPPLPDGARDLRLRSEVSYPVRMLQGRLLQEYEIGKMSV